MNDDNHQSVVTRESNNEERKGERVIKKYLSDLIKMNKHINKVLLISVIEHYVFKNTKIFTRLGIIMHLPMREEGCMGWVDGILHFTLVKPFPARFDDFFVILYFLLFLNFWREHRQS